MTAQEKQSDIDIINSLIRKVRDQLAEKYDTESRYAKHFCYQGLSEEACCILSDELFKYNAKHKTRFRSKIYTGQLVHSPKTLSKYWNQPYCVIEIDTDVTSIICDPIALSLVDMYGTSVLQMFIGKGMPWYFYPDDKNPAKHGIGLKINALIWFQPRHDMYGVSEDWHPSIGLIEFIQYNIIGRISDMIRYKRRGISG